MQLFIFDGHLVADPERRSDRQGNAICAIRVANNQPFAREGEAEAIFWNVSIFGNQAEPNLQNLYKGREVTVYGRITRREVERADFTNDAGQAVTVAYYDVVARDIVWHGRNERNPQNGQAQGAPAAQAEPVPAAATADDGMPF